MNNNLLAIVKQIIAIHGEGVLGDPARLKPIFKDYTKDLPKEERVAFGRCIEQGFYPRIKAAKTKEERRRLKADMARHLQGAAGISAALSTGALDILDAVVPLNAATSVPSTPRTQGASGLTEGSGKLPGLVSRKALVFGVAGGIGAFVGEMVSGALRVNMTFSDALGAHVLEIAFWAGILSLSISIALLTVQYTLQRKQPNLKKILPPTLLGIATGAAAGGIAQMAFNVTQKISPLIRTTSNALCWGLFGVGLGLGVSLFIPNYPKKRAILAGFLGGTLGGAIYVALLSSATNVGGLIGVIVLGLFIGLAISIIEEALREAWLTVVWGPKETTTISLGTKPVVFGSSREADVYLTQRRGQPEIPLVRAIVSVEGGRVILDDRASGIRRELHNGETADLGRVSIITNIKTK
jgi:hypothetical protein